LGNNVHCAGCHIINRVRSFYLNKVSLEGYAKLRLALTYMVLYAKLIGDWHKTKKF